MFETPKVSLKYSSNRITTQNATVARITLTLCLFLTVSCVLRRTILLNQIRAKAAKHYTNNVRASIVLKAHTVIQHTCLYVTTHI